VVDYLNSLSKEEVNHKVSDILVAALLHLAWYHSGEYTPEQLWFACWESLDVLNKHGSNLRLALGVEQPPFVVPNYVTPVASVMNSANTNIHNSITDLE
jgi:hypothetical protein